MPGPALDGASLWDLCQTEGVESAWGVPTIWQGCSPRSSPAGQARGPAPHRRRRQRDAPQPDRGLRTSGHRRNHAWGMTETSPLGSQGR
ncbi:hypothetical protein FLP41_08960 [Paracoccus marcusii]|uniref:hypothetical protein n=1 Tax=Paracoccus marcusii TaxID=59779 RepID=UPI002ED51ED4|nr:hypothetical protein FLP41_08960 [Paracoccus marcusii]